MKRISNDEPLTLTGDTALDSELVERDGHWWKLCKLCQRTLLSDPGAFGSFAICLGCFNTYMEAGILPPFTHDLVRAALDTGELRREQLRISVRKTKP